jgi:hypothetical protein
MTGINGLSVIGYFIWWSVNNQRIKRDKMQKLIDTAGIKDKKGKPFKVPEAKYRSAFLKAVREIRGQHKNKGILIRKIKKDADEYLFGLVDEKVNKSAKSLQYTHDATMRFIPSTGYLRVNRKHRGFDLVKERYEEYKDYLNSDDVRDIVLTILNQVPTVSVRQRGGIYFVPEKFSDAVDRLETLVGSLPGGGNGDLSKVSKGSANGSYLAIAPQIDTEKSKKAIYKAFVASLKSRMESFENDLEEKGITQKHALKNRLQEFKDMRAEIAFYRDALEFQVEDLTDSLKALTKKVKQKLLK